MKVFMNNGAVMEICVSPEEAWIVCQLVKKGCLEAVLVSGSYVAPVRKIDLERTFGDLIAATVHDTAPPDSEAVAGR